jgi:protein neuralized
LLHWCGNANFYLFLLTDLTNKVGFWAKALAERYAVKDSVLFFYVTSAGDVHFGVDGEEKGIFFTGVETRGPVWALLDLYGNCTAVELIGEYFFRGILICHFYFAIFF